MDQMVIATQKEIGDYTFKKKQEKISPRMVLSFNRMDKSFDVVKGFEDGDTVYMRDGTKVRLHGIDTPERDQLYGTQATGNLNKLIGGKVFVVEKDTDRYGRLVGVIYTPEGVNVNEAMVCNGSAWWYSRYAKSNRAMARCQDEAKEAGLGLWADSDPMPPWEWRRR